MKGKKEELHASHAGKVLAMPNPIVYSAASFPFPPPFERQFSDKTFRPPKNGAKYCPPPGPAFLRQTRMV